MTKKTRKQDKKRTPRRPLSLRYADGSVQTFTPRPADGADAVRINLARMVNYGSFKVCPICLVAPAAHREHVPPDALGGRRLLRTCELCNVRLGRHLEGDLANWYDGSFRMAFSSNAIRGRRRFAKTRIMPPTMVAS